MSIGKKIKALRKENGVTISQLSNLSGVSTTYILGVENKGRNVSINILSKISTALGVHITDLLPSKEEEAAA